jgi:putative two-component system response regulator
LHDIGKTMMPDQLLKDGGKYDDVEWSLIERHTLDGAKIFEGSTSPILQIAASIALTHHERWDGSGYPNQLKGEEIPLAGRICAIADVFDALTTARSYKLTISMEEALNLILESSGVLFDPALVWIFNDQFEEIKKIRLAVGG